LGGLYRPSWFIGYTARTQHPASADSIDVGSVVLVVTWQHSGLVQPGIELKVSYCLGCLFSQDANMKRCTSRYIYISYRLQTLGDGCYVVKENLRLVKLGTAVFTARCHSKRRPLRRSQDVCVSANSQYRYCVQLAKHAGFVSLPDSLIIVYLGIRCGLAWLSLQFGR